MMRCIVLFLIAGIQLSSVSLAQSLEKEFQPGFTTLNKTTLNKKSKHTSKGVTGHFTVKGDKLKNIKRVSSLGDDLVKQLHQFIGEPIPKQSKYPINIVLYSQGKAKSGVKYTSSVIPVDERGYVIEVVVDVRDGYDRSVIEQGMMQGLILERTMRANPNPNSDVNVAVPRWLSDGLLGALKWKDTPTGRNRYELLKMRPELYPVKDLFKSDDKVIEALGQTRSGLYHASATAMVLAMQRQEGGKSSLSKLLADVAVFEGEPEELLRRYFASLNVGARSLQKLWNLQVSDMAAARMLDTLTIIQTEKRLSKLLFFTLGSTGTKAKIIALEDYDILDGLAHEARIQVMQSLMQRIQQLSYRCYPDYQPILAEYGFILSGLMQGNDENVAQRLQRLSEVRALKLEAGVRVRNVLDWYQISEAKGLKGDFTGYDQLIRQIELEHKKNADPVIAPYVNQMESLMKR